MIRYISRVLWDADLEGGDLQGVLHQGGCFKNNGLRDEGRLDGPRVKQVGVVAHFAKLHEDVDHGHEVTTGESFPGSEGQKKEVVSKGPTGLTDNDQWH